MTEHDTDGGKAIPARRLRELIAAIKSAKKSVKRINEGKNAEVNTAVARYGVSRKVLALAAWLDDLEAGDLADWRDEFDFVWDTSGLGKRAASAPRFEALTHQDAASDAEETAAA